MRDIDMLSFERLATTLKAINIYDICLSKGKDDERKKAMRLLDKLKEAERIELKGQIKGLKDQIRLILVHDILYDLYRFELLYVNQKSVCHIEKVTSLGEFSSKTLTPTKKQKLVEYQKYIPFDVLRKIPHGDVKKMSVFSGSYGTGSIIAYPINKFNGSCNYWIGCWQW